MSNNYEDYGYEDENGNSNNKSGLGKKLLIILFIIIAIFIIIYLLKGCSGNNKVNEPEKPVVFDYESTLLNAGKTYFENNKDEYPVSAGQCSEVSLQTLIDKGLIDPNNFGSCNMDTSYVRVCLLSNGNKQFTPWLTCTDKKSDNEYGESKEGTINDIIANSTYVEFRFLPEVVKAGEQELGPVEEIWKSDITYSSYKTLATTKYYRYRDKLFTWDVTTKKYYTSTGEKTKASDVKEYYTIAPNSNYNKYDSKTTEAYKWYTTTATKVYALGSNGSKALSPSPIGEYTKNEGGVVVKMYETRTVKETYSPQLYHVCAENASSTIVAYQTATCGNGANKNFTYEKKTVYSCKKATDNSSSVIDNIVSGADSKCYTYSEWSSPKSTPCDTNLSTCISVSKTFYYWYKLDNNGARTYIPSGKSTASQETIYYTSSPKSGAIKDETTKATAYKWFKSSTSTTTNYTATAPSGYSSASKTSNYKWTDWSKWSKTNPKISDGRTREIENKAKIKLQEIKGTTTDGWQNLNNNTQYLTEEELIKMFKDNNYNVNSLEDINNNGEIRYQVKMYLKNKKETSK